MSSIFVAVGVKEHTVAGRFRSEMEIDMVAA